MPHIVTVCTGNICRSPAAELLLADAVGDAATVASAGTHGLVGHGIPDEMLTELAADGIDGTVHEGRLLTQQIIADADIVIAMTREHRQLIVQLEPRGLRKVFTLSELAAAAGTGASLTGDTFAERLASLPVAIAAHRPVLAQYELDDVPDPYRRPQAVYHEAYGLIRGGVAEFAAWVQDA
ncbi:arsenate reductase/protein-tyrosine-phosphatase family protein [Demequina maris]|uniref:arsenate reductase/protein-tyrosine-phosphatase family protein n=1 Tax=Demequina maris TaxID=1638982 RepID=UPI000784569E|nr:low molecular weight phosphatase family protein [Demequina maris]